MREDTSRISFNPTKKQLLEIRQWLQTEDAQSGEGFFCNWNSIKYSFDSKQMVIIETSGKVIGFMTWHFKQGSSTIQLAEIHPNFRKLGFCKLMLDQLSEKLVKLDVFALELHCQPEKSEQAWKKLGFKRFPKTSPFTMYHTKGNIHLYKILAPCLSPTKTPNSQEAVALFDDEPYLTQSKKAIWRWNLCFNKNSRILKKPIIFPAKRDQRIQWSNGNEVVKDHKIKHFLKEDIDFGNFLIIKKLPQI